MTKNGNMGAPSGFFEGWDSGRVEENLALELLPSSGSGITELYRSRSGGRNRLYKVLSPQYRGNLLYESILRKEFEIGFSLTHQGICAYYGFINLHGLGNAIELEWIEGCTLREWLALNPSRKQRRLILDQLLDALSYMHRKQVVHRDLKPENIMVTYQGNHVKIIDFGFSDSDAHAVNKGPAGTQAYAAPELLEGKGPDQRSDIYSVGLIMDELTPWLGRITRKCKAPDPEKRYQSVSELQKSVLSRRRIWIIPAVVAAAATVVLAAHNRTYSDSEVDALVREAEEAISSTISLSE